MERTCATEACISAAHSSGVASAFFVVTANAWMQQPTGFDQVNGRIVAVDPWAAMFNRATPPETAHLIVAAFMVAGFAMAGVYASVDTSRGVWKAPAGTVFVYTAYASVFLLSQR